MCVDEKKINSCLGFTLIELMIVVAIAGIVMTVGIPSFNQTIANSRLTTNVNVLVSSLNFARSEAVKRNLPITVRKSGTNWEAGWTVFTDQDGDGTKETGDILIRTYDAMPSDYTLRGETPSYTNRVTYLASGLSADDGAGGNAGGSFVLCDNSDSNNTPEASTSKVVNINSVGRASMGRDIDNDGIPEIADGTEIISCTVSPFT